MQENKFSIVAQENYPSSTRKGTKNFHVRCFLQLTIFKIRKQGWCVVLMKRWFTIHQQTNTRLSLSIETQHCTRIEVRWSWYVQSLAQAIIDKTWSLGWSRGWFRTNADEFSCLHELWHNNDINLVKGMIHHQCESHECVRHHRIMDTGATRMFNGNEDWHTKLCL